MTDFTILDAPETPAPIFAFRALKGAIFGSPNNDDEQNNKENTIPAKTVNTLRSKISALRASSVSPSKRRKTNQYASPAKSILRTPGIPTPRKPNANVTFKDVTPSLSPELTRKDLMQTEQLACQDFKSTTVADQPRAEPVKRTLSKETPITAPQISNEIQASQTDRVSQQVDATFDFEDYRLSTEKEMKKLVRYGQRMREYARKQDEENTKLRIVLEELQKENEELRSRESLHDYVRQGKKDENMSEKAIRQVPKAKPGRKSIPEKEVAKSSQLDADQVAAKSRVASVASRTSGASKAKSLLHKQLSPLKRKASTQLEPDPPILHGSKATTQADSQAMNESSNEQNAPTSWPIGARLPLERVAAARERIRLKAELRRKTAANTSSPVKWDAL